MRHSKSSHQTLIWLIIYIAPASSCWTPRCHICTAASSCWIAAQSNSTVIQWTARCSGPNMWLAGVYFARGKTEAGLIIAACWFVTRSHVAACLNVLFLVQRVSFQHGFSTCRSASGSQLLGFPLILRNIGDLVQGEKKKKKRKSEPSACWLMCHSVSQVNLVQPAEAIHNWIRGHDKVPGAWTVIDGQVGFLERTRKIHTLGVCCKVRLMWLI